MAHKVKTFKEAAEELRTNGFKTPPPNCVCGTEFEEWLNKRHNDTLAEAEEQNEET